MAYKLEFHLYYLSCAKEFINDFFQLHGNTLDDNDKWNGTEKGDTKLFAQFFKIIGGIPYT